MNALINDSRTFEEVIEQGGHSTFDVDGMPLEAKISRIYGGDHDFEGYIITLKEAKRATLGASRGKLGDTANVTFKDILGKSYQIAKAKKLASRFARSRENILLVGRERHRQGAVRPGHPQPGMPRRSLHVHQLRRHPAPPHRKRTLRL